MNKAFGILSVVVGVSLLACATGVDTSPSTEYLGAAPADAGAEEEDEATPLPPSSSGEDASAVSDATPDAGKKGDAGSPPKDAGVEEPVVTGPCAAVKPCSGATKLGSVSGDTGSDALDATGSVSQWFSVRVTENDTSVSGLDLWMTATLVSPPGENFDLFLYVPSTDTQECKAVSVKSTSTGATDKATAKFGETGLFANSMPDDRTVTIEVRHVSGSCDASKSWTLDIVGNE